MFFLFLSVFVYYNDSLSCFLPFYRRFRRRSKHSGESPYLGCQSSGQGRTAIQSLAKADCSGQERQRSHIHKSGFQSYYLTACLIFFSSDNDEGNLNKNKNLTLLSCGKFEPPQCNCVRLQRPRLQEQRFPIVPQCSSAVWRFSV